MKKIPAAKPFFSSSMPRSRIMDEIRGSSARDTLVRSMYEIVYMMSATGMMRSQRCSFIIERLCLECLAISRGSVEPKPCPAEGVNDRKPQRSAALSRDAATERDSCENFYPV